jgi:exonuclease SbcD
LGAETSSSERTFIGAAENIDSGIFSKFSYVALGHIHKPQKVSENVYYSGSPLAYSFDEIKYEKSFLKIEIQGKDDIKIEKIPANPKRKLRTIKDSFVNFLEKTEYQQFKDDYIEFLCTDSVYPNSAAATLRKFFPNYMTMRIASESEETEENQKFSDEIKQKMFEEKESLPIKDVFEAFVKDIYGKDLTEYEKEVKILEKIASGLEKEE